VNRALRLTALMAAAVLLVYGCGGAPKASKETEELLTAMVGEYGGEGNLLMFNAYTIKLGILAVVKQDTGVEGRFVLQPKDGKPGKLRNELLYAKSPAELRVFDGEKGYGINNGKPGPIKEGPQVEAMRLQLMRLYTPLTLLGLKDKMAISSDGKYKILTLKEGAVTANYYVNPETKRIELFKGSFDAGGAPMEFGVEYSDFKKTPEGFLWPMRERKFAGGVNTAITEVREIYYAVQFGPEIFRTEPLKDTPKRTKQGNIAVRDVKPILPPKTEAGKKAKKPAAAKTKKAADKAAPAPAPAPVAAPAPAPVAAPAPAPVAAPSEEKK